MGSSASRKPDAKVERINIRATEEEKALVEAAARASHMSATQFMMQAAIASAEDVLAEQRVLLVPPEDWDAFMKRLDEPARVIPELREALEKRGMFFER